MGGGARRFVVLAGLGVLLLGSLVAVRAAFSAPQRPDGMPLLERFEPEALGSLEQQAWEAYYYREWPRLFSLLWELMASKYGLSPAQAMQATYVATRAQMVWAERGAEGGEAERLMREFYVMVREPAGGQYDPARAAELEINWWAVHRQRANYPDLTALTDALAASWAEVYQIPAAAVRPAAEHRARAMDASDLWIARGKERESPLLTEVRDELVACYASLRAALDARAATTAVEVGRVTGPR